ncbi:MAG: hypothetical protein NW220_16955 [Leptolyngbyaceae cyanobacterium bins.349]|nr:hypothetical protein [Leptolyngbyaceae cyanobacterium bins.349]
MTLNIDGPYFPLVKFRKALDSFIDLLTEIDRETSDNGSITIEWAIESIRSGSIHITAVATPVNEELYQERPSQVIEVVSQGIDQLQEAPVIPEGFSEAALKFTKTFGELINPDDFAEIRFGSNGWARNIAPRLAGNVDEITKTTQKYYGSLEGTLVSISLSGRQTLGIRSTIEGKTIRCYFKDDMFETAKEALGQRVYVFGLIRQRSHGPKINIQVDELRIIPPKEQMPSVSEILARLRGAG